MYVIPGFLDDFNRHRLCDGLDNYSDDDDDNDDDDDDDDDDVAEH
jgi:hypothetical protein